MKSIIIKQGHKSNCCIKGTKDEYYFTKEIFHGNLFGNLATRGNHYGWLTIYCNDPRCNFRAVMSLNKISTMIKSYVKYHKL